MLPLLCLPLTPAMAQSSGTTAEDAISNARDMYGPPPPRRNCNNQQSGDSQSEITVCAQEEEDNSEFRVQSTSDLRKGKGDGSEGVPDVAGDGIFKGPASIGGLCLMGGCPPEEAYMLDFDALPDTPEGSEADKIAKGQKRAD